MKITGADHANWRINDVERSLAFYHDVLGLDAFGLEEYREGKRSFVSVRVSPTFTLHLRPDPDPRLGYAGSRDHLALVVEGADPENLKGRMREAELEVERFFGSALGARGDGPALYISDPDGHLIELKVYGP